MMQPAPNRGPEILQITIVIIIGSFFFFDIIGVFGLSFAIGGLVIAIIGSILIYRLKSTTEGRS